jgi:hypothetical protein
MHSGNRFLEGGTDRVEAHRRFLHSNVPKCIIKKRGWAIEESDFSFEPSVGLRKIFDCMRNFLRGIV